MAWLADKTKKTKLLKPPLPPRKHPTSETDSIHNTIHCKLSKNVH